MVKFLVLALFYGDHPALAHPCATTLPALWNTGRVDLRIGLNEASPATRAVLDELLPGVQREEADPQIYKYPMLRRLLAGYTGDATHLMWFDDDTALRPGLDVAGWLEGVERRAAQTPGSLGSLYTQALTPVQQAWVRQQPWYTGRALPREVLFNTGGWFVVPLALIRRCDWPGPHLRHGGGDILLGALLHQQGLAPEQFRVGLAINADAHGRESAAARRGVTEAPQPGEHRIWGEEP